MPVFVLKINIADQYNIINIHLEYAIIYAMMSESLVSTSHYKELDNEMASSSFDMKLPEFGEYGY